MSGIVQPMLMPAAITLRSAYDLEVQIVAAINALFADTLRLDNPTLNLAQTGEPGGNDVPPVPYDYTQRAQTLALKVAPRVVRGRIPRTVTGIIDATALPDVPNIIVQAVAAKVETQQTLVTVHICASAYDENPDSQGYQDLLNIVEAMAMYFTSYGQAGLAQAYPIVLPLEWKAGEAEKVDTFPHYVFEMTTQWQLSSGRPMPDIPDGIVPMESPEFRLQFDPTKVAAP